MTRGTTRRDVRVGCIRTLALMLVLALVPGCAVNPVTGERELVLVSRERAIAIGEEQYAPSQQMQGGEYTVDPELSAYVSRVGQRVAAVSDVDLPYEFVVLNNSVPNAWALPGGKIAVNRGLLTKLRNEAELAAVLGHEITHAAARHGAKSMERGMVLQGALLAAMIGARNSDYASAVVGAGMLGAQLVNQRYSRNAEREADYYGTRYMKAAGYDPRAAASLQEVFLKLSEDRETSWIEGLFASHPPSAERVENNRALAAKLGPGGEFGAERYQEALAYLRSKEAAYDAYDEARSLAADGDLEAAAAKVAEALEVEPDDAAIHGLRGDIRLAQERYGDAIANYDRALALDDGYFGYYVGRGIARSRSGERRLAAQDLKRSLTLLPTAVAYRELGQIAEARGNRAAALRYYEAASASQSNAGQAAARDYVRLDIGAHPERYVATAFGSAAGQPVLQVSNRAGVTLEDVELRLRVVWQDGRQQTLAPRVAHLTVDDPVLIGLPVRNVPVAGVEAVAVQARLAE